MTNFFKLVAVLPAIFTAVKQAEDFVPISGQGKAKLDFVLGLLQDTLEEIGTLLPLITKAISRVVELANATGLFRKAG